MEGKLTIILSLSVVLTAFYTVAAEQNTNATASSTTFPKDAVPPYATLPEPLKGFYEATEKCLKELTDKCGDEMWSGVNHNATVSNECCKKLSNLSTTCRNNIVTATMIVPRMSDTDRMKMEAGFIQVRRQCTNVSSTPVGTTN